MWNYEVSNEFPPQRFGLTRTLDWGEVPTVLIKDGEFNGKFGLTYHHVNFKGKKKERSKIIKEEGFKFIFKKKESNLVDISVSTITKIEKENLVRQMG